MDRRQFIRHLGLGLAAGWAFGRLSWPLKALGAGAGTYKKLCLALLADAHLKDGDDRRPEAQALARAVAEINTMSQPPDLVLFAGDLVHQGRPDALDLGREILSDLSSPLWAVKGEGDCGRGRGCALEPALRLTLVFPVIWRRSLPGSGHHLVSYSPRPDFRAGTGSTRLAGPAVGQVGLRHAPGHRLPRPLSAALSSLATVDRGRAQDCAAPGPLPPGAVPARARPRSRGRE